MKDFFLDSDIDEIIKMIGAGVNHLEGKRILITGGGGFLGRYFLLFLNRLNKTVFKKPVEVTLVDLKFKEDFGQLDIKHIHLIEHDVTKPFPYLDTYDLILHGAGIPSPFYYQAYPLETLDVATQGTRNMLEIARRNKARFLFMSSSEIYGNPDPKHVPTPESYSGNVSPMGSRSCYDESKRLGETLCYIFNTRYGVPTISVRPFNIYGPGMDEADYRVLPNFASRIKAGEAVKVYGSGEQTRTFCYVTDAINGFTRALLFGVPGQAYNIGNPTPEISMLKLVEYVKKISDKPVKSSVIEYPDSYPSEEAMRRCPNIVKAQLHLDYNPKVTLENGLERFLRWADKNYIGKFEPSSSNKVYSIFSDKPIN
ncbi:MAG: NAD-dependent epimerase/dehydratase family protein [Magnetococcales bacterium]|nr:NAD-dependent epimerase/dehydratase family protein [Magnetococcales bacterium]